MSGQKAKGGKRNRKFNRNRDRSPAQARYKGEQRWVKNKVKKVRAHLTRSKAHAEKRGCDYDHVAEKWLSQNA